MMRWIGLGMGGASLCAAWLAAATPVAKAGETRRVEITRSAAGRLGVALRDVENGEAERLKLSEERGAVVKDVTADSAAQKAGVKEGDVILRYQGETVQSAAQLARLVRETPPGRKVALEISRDGALQKVQATVEERKGEGLLADGDMHFDFAMPPMPAMPALPPMPATPPVPKLDDGPEGRHMFRELLRERGPRKLGIEYLEIQKQLAHYFRLSEDEAILVSSVEEDGPAGHAGLKAGDIVLKIDGKPVHDAGDLREKVARLTAGQDATISVQRDGKPLDLKVKVGGRAESHRKGDET